ncbi:MAG TPA: hypothetical protein VNW94_05505, partial [Streptosporangiaceae bacterium]|nr:hypothetical protein [Streptosporangiaceae bacterium]
NGLHAQRPDNPTGAAAALPPDVAVRALDPVAVGRDVAHALGAQVRIDVTRPDGTVRQTWIDPDGRTFAFDPARTRTDPNAGGAVWVFDPATSRNRFFSAAVAEANGLLTPAQRAESDVYGLTYNDLGRLYLTTDGWTFAQEFNAEIATRAQRLASLHPALPDLLRRAADAQAYWGQEAERLQRRQNDADPVAMLLELFEQTWHAQWNQESATQILGWLRTSARGGPGGRTWTEDEIRAIAGRLLDSVPPLPPESPTPATPAAGRGQVTAIPPTGAQSTASQADDHGSPMANLGIDPFTGG